MGQCYGMTSYRRELVLGMLAQLYYNFNGGEYTLLNRFGTHPIFDKQDANMATFLSTMQRVQQYAPLTMEKSFSQETLVCGHSLVSVGKPTWRKLQKPMVIGEDVGLAPIPTLNKGDQSYSTLDGRALMIFKSDQELEQLSWQFVQVLMDDELNHKANMTLGQLPALVSLKERPITRVLRQNRLWSNFLYHHE
ncbi:hypothetical protein [Vibrio taketomensis]|uniref:hypothetical protein n=1 Tax=Vibrio taketomensis TaxID=2572923 RepID=UPI001E466134|nr:hypothetical protein [Vibrio taketomensis]